MSRRKQTRPTYTVNQVIASNVAKARMLRGWTQHEAADALLPYLGTRLSPASFSAIERSVDGGRVREFDADEIFAFARGFGLPIGFFFTPPSPNDNIGIAAPDAPPSGLAPVQLLDAVLGTTKTLDEWNELLLVWPLMDHRMRIGEDGTIENVGRFDSDVHQRLGHLDEARAAMLVRESLGDVDEARHVLLKLADLLDHIGDESEPNEASNNSPPGAAGPSMPISRSRKK